MARGDNGPNISKMFQDIFEERPELLERSSNTEVYELFQKRHPDVPFEKRVTQICANKKSAMKAAKGIPSKRKRKRKGTARSAASAARATTAPKAAAVKEVPQLNLLESLEGSLEEVIREAEGIDSRNLGSAVKYLRRARNLVSYRIQEVEGI